MDLRTDVDNGKNNSYFALLIQIKRPVKAILVTLNLHYNESIKEILLVVVLIVILLIVAAFTKKRYAVERK